MISYVQCKVYRETIYSILRGFGIELNNKLKQKIDDCCDSDILKEFVELIIQNLNNDKESTRKLVEKFIFEKIK